MLWWEWLENKLVVGEKFVFYEAYEEAGVARSHFGFHSNTVDLFVVVVTMDITSLYSVIPNNEGLQALKYFFNQRPIKKPSSEPYSV